jgi:ribonuclease D
MSDCPELAKLQRQYKLALKVWGEQEFAVYNAPVATEATRIALVQNKQHFVSARNAAAQRVLDHQSACPVCKQQP